MTRKRRWNSRPESGDHDFASQHGPLVRIPVCVPVERRKSTSLWLDVVWLPCAMLTGGLVAIPWTQLENDGDAALYFAGMADIELYRTEADRYRSNLDSGAPSVWVALQRIDGEPPYKLAAVTADPAEGESLTEPGTAVVEAVSRTVPLSPRHRQHGRAFRRRRRRDRDGVSDFSTTHWSSRHDDG